MFRPSRVAAVVVLAAAFVFGLFAAVHLASALPPGFCGRHPTNPNCVSSTLSTASTTTSTTSSTTTTTATTSSTSSTTTTGTTTTSSPPQPFGISDGADIVYEADATRLRELDSMQAVGAKWARFDFAWSVIEGSPGAFNVAYLDTAVREAQTRGMTVLATIAYAPAWANGGHTDDKYPPTNAVDYGRIAGRIAAHFAPLGVHAYELWNEPNISVFWKPTPDVAAYSALVKAAYPAIHAADPQALVLAGATAPHGTYQDTNCDGDPDGGRDATGYSPIDFLEGMYANAAPFDAFSHHPYERYLGLAYHVCSAWSQMQETNPSLRSMMSAHGDAGKRIWATEYGNAVPDWTNEQGQADRLKQAMTAWKSFAWAGVFFEFNLWDAHGSVFGLLRPDFTQRPSWVAFRAATS
jgi:polysaccharide biosynthesis protein PslG